MSFFNRIRRIRDRQERRQRGAALVEYAILVGAILIPVSYGIEGLTDGADTEVRDTAYDIGGQPGTTLPPVTTPTTAVPTTTTTNHHHHDHHHHDHHHDDPQPRPDRRRPAPTRTIVAGQWLTQIGTATDPDGTITSVDWDISGPEQDNGEGNFNPATGQSILEVRWLRPGTYTLWLDAWGRPGRPGHRHRHGQGLERPRPHRAGLVHHLDPMELERDALAGLRTGPGHQQLR